MRRTCLLLMVTWITASMAGCSAFEELLDHDTYADRYDPPHSRWSCVTPRYLQRAFGPGVNPYDQYPGIYRPLYLEWPSMNCGNRLEGFRPDLVTSISNLREEWNGHSQFVE